MSSRGSLQRKCVKAHPKTAGRCSSRCIRWYPRLELPRGPDGTRRFEALGGYPTRAQAEAALADALARRSHGFALDPAKLTVDQYLDRWLTHLRTSLRARTVARYAAMLRDHARPDIGTRPLKQLTPLEIQAIYDRLAVGGRRDGKPGGLAPQHILAVHRCLHRALQQAVTWRLLARNTATDATPPPVPSTDIVTLAPEQVALLLDAADRSPSPWLGTWTILAAATGARNGELCGLEWADLDLDASTVRFRQALTIIDPAVLPDADPGSSGRRKELAVGPLKSTASGAILTLPPFAVQALRQHRRQQARQRLAGGQAQTVTLRRVEPGRPAYAAELDLVFRTERGTPVNPNHASRAFPAWPPASGWPPTPTCCGMRWPRRWRPTRNLPASSPPSSAMPTVARSPSGSTSTSYPRPRPGWPGSSRASSAQRRGMGRRCRQRVGRRETGGKPDPQTQLDWTAHSRIVAGQRSCGRDRIRTCEGNAGDFTGRSGGSPRIPSHPHWVPHIAGDQHKRPVDSPGRHSASLPVPPRPGRPSVGRSEDGAKSGAVHSAAPTNLTPVDSSGLGPAADPPCANWVGPERGLACHPAGGPPPGQVAPPTAGRSSWPPGGEQAAAEQDQASEDQQGGDGVAAGPGGAAAADADDGLEQHREGQEGGQAGRDQPAAAGDQVPAAAGDPDQPAADPGADHQQGPGGRPGLEPVDGVESIYSAASPTICARGEPRGARAPG
jgi:integrase